MDIETHASLQAIRNRMDAERHATYEDADKARAEASKVLSDHPETLAYAMAGIVSAQGRKVSRIHNRAEREAGRLILGSL
jgi:hypothetical protein